jgi:beta-xylosidase
VYLECFLFLKRIEFLTYKIQDDGKFVMYYSGEVKNWGSFHCVGVAVSNGTDPLGPYIPEDKPLACPHDLGGAIDPSPFRDADGTLYVVYKGDGNSIGHGGNCNNGKKPIVSVPILLQELKSDGVTTVGKPKKILDIDDTDGPLVEAPDLMRTDNGVYYLFFSSHCYTSLGYNVKYAHSTSIEGPYKRADRPLLQTADWDLLGPGGATVSADGKKIVFHANCGSHRCMYAGAIDIKADNTVVMSSLLGSESLTSTNSTVSSR